MFSMKLQIPKMVITMFDETDVIRKKDNPKKESESNGGFLNGKPLTFKQLKKASKIKIIKLPFVCHARGYEIECEGIRCIAHIVTRQFQYLKTSKHNQLDICKAHEEYFNKVGNKVWWNFVKINFPTKYNFIKEHKAKADEQLRQAKFAVAEYKEFLYFDNG